MLRESPGTVVVPSGDQAGYTDFWICLRRMALPHDTYVAMPKGANIADNLNKAFRSIKGDWVQIWGNDHTFAPDLLSKLLDRLDANPDVDIIVPLCAKRRPPFFPPFCVKWWEQDSGAMDQLPWAMVPPPDPPLMDVDRTGLAGAVIRRRVVDEMADPWFEWNTRYDKTRVPHVKTHMGEDYEFCVNAKKQGFRICVDLENSIGHIVTPSVVPKWNGKKWVQQLVIDDRVIATVEQRVVSLGKETE